jgi:poly [ADP-ribose] polymerase
MSNVEDFLAKYPYEFQTILQKEQDLIDVLLTSIQSLESAGTKDQVSLLGSLGITIRPVTKEEGEHLHGKLMSNGDWDIRNALMGTSSKRYRRAWRITNLKTQDRFDKYRHSFSKKKYVKELFHGSKTSNFLSILKNGLIIRPTSTNGSMYGRGLYFADDADKSMGYGSQSYGSRWVHGNADKGYLAVFDVMLGDMYLHTSYDSSLNWDKLQRIAKGKDSVFAKKENTGLRKNEYIIYKESQATIKYLIEYT